MIEISSLMDQVPVYTRRGTFVGHVKNAILDLTDQRVEAILVTRTNTEIVEDGLDVAIPYRWVHDFDDILVLRYFPERVTRAEGEEIEAAEAEEFIEVPA